MPSGHLHALYADRHGQSMLPVTPSNLTPDFLQHISCTGTLFSMSRRLGISTPSSRTESSIRVSTRQRPMAQDIFRDTHPIEWLIGAGVNGFGAIVRRDDYLFQTPQSFYSKPKTWGPSPGYELIDLGFNRPIQAGCIFCHSGRPRPIAGTNGKFESKTVLRAFNRLRELPMVLGLRTSWR